MISPDVPYAAFRARLCCIFRGDPLGGIDDGICKLGIPMSNELPEEALLSLKVEFIFP